MSNLEGRKRGHSGEGERSPTAEAFKKFTEFLRPGATLLKLRRLVMHVDSSVGSRPSDKSPFVLLYCNRRQDFGNGLLLFPEEYANAFLQYDFPSTIEALAKCVTRSASLETPQAIDELADWMTNARENGTSPFSYLDKSDLFQLDAKELNSILEAIDAPKEPLTPAQIYDQFMKKVQERGFYLSPEKAAFLLTHMFYLDGVPYLPPLYAAGYRKFSRERYTMALMQEEMGDLEDIAALLFRSVMAECILSEGKVFETLDDVPKHELLALHMLALFIWKVRNNAIPEEDFNVFNPVHCALPTSAQRKVIDSRLLWEGTKGFELKRSDPPTYKAIVAGRKLANATNGDQALQEHDVSSLQVLPNNREVPQSPVLDNGVVVEIPGVQDYIIGPRIVEDLRSMLSPYAPLLVPDGVTDDPSSFGDKTNPTYSTTPSNEPERLFQQHYDDNPALILNLDTHNCTPNFGFTTSPQDMYSNYATVNAEVQIDDNSNCYNYYDNHCQLPSGVENVGGFLYFSSFVRSLRERFLGRENQEGNLNTFVLEHLFSIEEIHAGTPNGDRSFDQLAPLKVAAFYNIIKHLTISSPTGGMWTEDKGKILKSWLSTRSSHIRTGIKKWNNYNKGGISAFVGKM